MTRSGSEFFDSTRLLSPGRLLILAPGLLRVGQFWFRGAIAEEIHHHHDRQDERLEEDQVGVAVEEEGEVEGVAEIDPGAID
ncbi:hypothetical protein KHQ06_13265 [Nocardia tengchongensis]|uniref:Uncharacterized protein n=1 Tax=Nocardia tengchongensis TaxID=2055889 RepID=A0ABX8CVT0_9NOCA|nr:hypothetical protein [Nocardia tengchongensis]QVI23712.1 hypothetical protein KHQ06_13265 [Nocardia tengchongensis]